MCGRPAVPPDVNEALVLWGRCKAWKVLPAAGGVFDQDEAVMGLLDVIEQGTNEAKAERHANDVAAAERDRMMRELG